VHQQLVLDPRVVRLQQNDDEENRFVMTGPQIIVVNECAEGVVGACRQNAETTHTYSRVVWSARPLILWVCGLQRPERQLTRRRQCRGGDSCDATGTTVTARMEDVAWQRRQALREDVAWQRIASSG
jgi:hypothetical protein